MDGYSSRRRMSERARENWVGSGSCSILGGDPLTVQ